MKQLTSLLFILLFFSCKKEGEKINSCLLTSINPAGSLSYPITYDNNGDITRVGNGTTTGASIFYNSSHQITRIEKPSENAYLKTEFSYNSAGQVSELKFYWKSGGQWLYQNNRKFEYVNNKLVSFNETAGTSQTNYNWTLTWTGGNVTSIVSRVNNQINCVQTFEYDLNKINNLATIKDLYFKDIDETFTGIKLSFYNSKNLLAKWQQACMTPATYDITYNLTKENQVDTVYANGQMIWSFKYKCN